MWCTCAPKRYNPNAAEPFHNGQLSLYSSQTQIIVMPLKSHLLCQLQLRIHTERQDQSDGLRGFINHTVCQVASKVQELQ
ncbi:hypothetical protein K474DRAFT_146382 [Panus rudis PR-1116 ss-1]|nr:hypothetical protein K474DRAFT_146382 [Panus rudis PR-1116 ss-1]